MDPTKSKRTRSSGTDQTLTRDEDTHAIVEKKAQKKRENQQLLLYILVCCTVALAWVLGTWQLSFFWVFCLAVLIFLVWKAKVLSLTEEYIKEKELLIHRKRALRQNETTEWLNFIINRWWVFSAATISDIVKKKFDPLLFDIMPSYLESLELESLSFGNKTPYIKFIQVYELADGVGGGKRPLSLSSAMQPPPGLQQAHQFQMVLEIDIGLLCDEFLMILQAKIPRCGSVDVAVEKLNIAGLLQVIVRLDMDAPFPHVASATVSFLEKPDVSFSVRMLKVIPLTDVPLLKSWVYHLVMNGISEALVDPGKIDLKSSSTGPTKILSKPAPKSLAVGVLTFTITGEFQKTHEKGKKDKAPTNQCLELMDDARFSVAMLGRQESSVQIGYSSEPWMHSDSFLVYNFKTDKLIIDVKSQVLLATQSIASFDMALSSLLFDQNQSCSLPLSKRLDDESLKIGLSLKYTPLMNIEKSIEQGALESVPSDSAAGVLYVCLHNATNVLGLDPNGFSDPYCIIYIGGKKLKATHYVARTRNPKWEVSAEVIVKDISKAVISFVVYDWDGRNSSEDDFLGSAHVLLSQDRPLLIRKSLNLGCHLAAKDPEEEGKLGSICVTAVFTPIDSITPDDSAVSQVDTRRQSLARPPVPATDSKSSKSKKSRSSLSSVGSTIEIRIIKAKDLVAMDRNGFSDPFCEVKVGGRKRYVTSVKKKTLNPVWDESVTTELPKQNETLDIIMWDQDVLFQKDFLGSLSFTLQDLMQHCNKVQNGGWFTLQRITSGTVQIFFKVDVYDNTPVAPVKENGGVHTELHSATPVPTESNPVISQLPAFDSISLTDTKSDLKDISVQSAPSKGYDTFPRVRKTASEMAISGNGNASDQTKSQSDLKTADTRSLNIKDEPKSAVSTDYYCGVRGIILGLTGLGDSLSHAYVKIRLVSPVDDVRKKPSAGYVIAKSTEFHPIPNLKLNVSFDVDRGRGVHKKSRLMLDVKSGRYSHIATRGFTLDEIFKGENNECTKWLELDNAITMQLKMSYDGFIAHGQLVNSHRSNSFLSSFRSSALKKIREQ